MTCRMKNGKNPIKIILDRELKTNFTSKIYQSTGEKIYLVIDKKISNKKIVNIPTHIEIIKCPTVNKKLDLKALLKKLFDLNIKSVLVEAGGELNGELVTLGVVDKIYQFVAPKILADNLGINAFYGRDVHKINNTLNFYIQSVVNNKTDLVIIYKPITT